MTAERTRARADLGAERPSLPRASIVDTLRALGTVLAPIVAQGPVIRRPRVVALAARLEADRVGVRCLKDLRLRYGPGPLMLRVPARPLALVLEPVDARRLLERTPDPFSAATAEKVAALRHFQPDGVLISSGTDRVIRRAINEAVLDTDEPLHRLAAPFARRIEREARALAASAAATGVLSWPEFRDAYARVVRGVVLGEAATDDTALTDMLAALRRDANWASLRPRREGRLLRFQERVDAYVRRADPDSLAAIVAEATTTRRVDAVGQIPHWLFAFDAGGITAMRTLAMLAAHPAAAQHARREAAAAMDAPSELPYLRACVQESLRLWPTTLVVLREGRDDSTWFGGAVAAAGTSFLIVSSYLHRAGDQESRGDGFLPEMWLDGPALEDPALIPFSAGPARCPGRDLLLFVTSTFLAALLNHLELRLTAPRVDPRSLPYTFNQAAVRFAVRPAV